MKTMWKQQIIPTPGRPCSKLGTFRKTQIPELHRQGSWSQITEQNHTSKWGKRTRVVVRRWLGFHSSSCPNDLLHPYCLIPLGESVSVIITLAERMGRLFQVSSRFVHENIVRQPSPGKDRGISPTTEVARYITWPWALGSEPISNPGCVSCKEIHFPLFSSTNYVLLQCVYVKMKCTENVKCDSQYLFSISGSQISIRDQEKLADSLCFFFFFFARKNEIQHTTYFLSRRKGRSKFGSVLCTDCF